MKKIITLILAMTMILSLASCSNIMVDDKQGEDNQQVSQDNKNDNKNDNENDSANDNQNENPDNENTDTDTYGEKYISDHLKGDYSITYKITVKDNSNDEEGLTVTSMKTKYGYYFNIYGAEMLYIKSGDKYDQYMGDGAGGFSKMTDEQITEEEVKSAAESVTSYMVNYEEFKDEMKKIGSETVAGRSCDKFSFEESSFGLVAKFEYCIDKETGVCLKYTIESKVSGETGAYGYNFECTEFKTSGVTLPKHN